MTSFSGTLTVLAVLVSAFIRTSGGVHGLQHSRALPSCSARTAATWYQATACDLDLLANRRGKSLLNLILTKRKRQTGVLRLHGGSSLKYYDILDLPKGPASTADEIKKAYKKKALKWHPDRVKADEKERAEVMFKKVSEAYQILSDSEKKSFYDRWGDSGVEAQRGRADSEEMSENPQGAYDFSGRAPAFDFNDPAEVFANFFGQSMGGVPGFGQVGGGLGGGMFGGGGLGRGMFGQTVFQAPGGVHVVLGGQPSGPHILAQLVSGLAQEFFARRAQPQQGPQSVHLGLECSLEDLLTGCTKQIEVPQGFGEGELEVEVQPGWKAGTRVTFMRQARGSDDMCEVVVVITEARHRTFTREGNDLHVRCRVSRADARAGTKLRVPQLGGRKPLVIPLKPTARSKAVRRVRGKGMPVKGGMGRGDLVVEVEVTSWAAKQLATLWEEASVGARHVGARTWATAKLWSLLGMQAVSRRLAESQWWQAVKQRAVEMAPQVVTFGVLLLVNPTYALIHAATLLLMHFGLVEFPRRPRSAWR